RRRERRGGGRSRPHASRLAGPAGGGPGPVGRERDESAGGVGTETGADRRFAPAGVGGAPRANTHVAPTDGDTARAVQGMVRRLRPVGRTDGAIGGLMADEQMADESGWRVADHNARTDAAAGLMTLWEEAADEIKRLRAALEGVRTSVGQALDRIDRAPVPRTTGVNPVAREYLDQALAITREVLGGE